MGVIQRFADGLQNVVAGLGTRRDKAAHNQYVDEHYDSATLLSAYRNSWLSKAIVDIPAEDATRNWRSWRAEADQISKIEEVERHLGLKRRLLDALIASRLYGGAAIYINTEDDSQELPLQPGQEIKSLIVITANSLGAKEVVKDINSPYFGRPEYYTITSGRDQNQVTVHASRFVILNGANLPLDTGMSSSFKWGDSVLQAPMDAIKNADGTMANIASLVFEAKINIFKFSGFAELLAQGPEGDAALIRRLSSQAAMKGISGDVVIDTLDEFDQRNASFSGLPEIVAKFMDAVSGAARIPVTRLYGRSAAGLSGSGDGDERVYFDRINYIQTIDVGPAMALLDECIINQALGSRPPEIYYEWNPLRQISESERADIFQKTANAARALAGSTNGAIIPIDALSDSLVNELVEQGVLPGLEQKIQEYGTLSEQEGFIEGSE